MKMLEINSRIRLVLLDNFFFSHKIQVISLAKFKLFLWFYHKFYFSLGSFKRWQSKVPPNNLIYL